MKLEIGEKIALLRKEKNITQTQLAEYLFVAPQTVSRWEADGGAPEITLLPKIAAFFGVSIDELFGLTSLERVEELVSKYSVLRDGRSFREAMECIDSQSQTIGALLERGAEDAAGLERDRDQLEAEKLHMWLQLGREAFQRAFDIADRFVKKTEGKPEHRWYLPMRLQRDQLCQHLGKGREALAERRRELAQRPSAEALHRCLAMLADRQDYEAVLAFHTADGPVGGILFPPRADNLDLWQQFIHAAAETGQREFVRRYLPTLLEVCGGQDEFDFLMCLLGLYEGEELAALQARLRALLPQMSLNKYFEEKAREQIESAGRQ